MKKSIKIDAMSFVEVLIAIAFLGVVALVLARFASSSLQTLIRDERTDQATQYAVNGEVILQSIANKNAAVEVTKHADLDNGNKSIEIFPEKEMCGGYFYLVDDDNGDYSFAHDASGNLLCAFGYEQGESAIRENCIDKNSPAYNYCTVKTLDGSEEEYFRYVHIEFPDGYVYGSTDYLLADVTVGQISNVNNNPTAKNYILDYKYHTSIKLETIDEYLITINLKNATIKGQTKYVEVTKEHERSYEIDVSKELKGEITTYKNCRGEVDSVLKTGGLDLTNIMSDVVCDIIYKEKDCVCGNNKVELECGEECEPGIVGEDVCSNTCQVLCGNGALDEGEVCERNNPDGVIYEWDNALCNHDTCKVECGNYDFANDCGNAVKECNEECDPAIDGRELCSNSCLWYCPDGIIEGDEVCEDGNPVGAKFDWNSPKCNQNTCKECVWSGTLTVLNGESKSPRNFTKEELEIGKVYLVKIDTSKGVTINNKSYTMDEVLATGYVKKDDGGYYVDLTMFCDVKAVVKYTMLEEVKEGTLVVHNTKTSDVKDFDIVFVIDVSESIEHTDPNREFLKAANKVIGKILEGENNRIGIVTFDTDPMTLLKLGNYKHTNQLLTAKGFSGYSAKYGGSDEGGGSTNTPAAINLAKSMFLSAKDVSGRKPVFILMTDGICYSRKAGLDCSNLNSNTFGVIKTSKNAKDSVSKYYGTDAGFYEMVIATRSESLNLVLDPSPTRIREYYRKSNNCPFIKSLINGAWTECTGSETSNGGLKLDSYSDAKLSKMSYSDGLYIGDNMKKVDGFLNDILSKLSTTDTRDLTAKELKERKVYLKNVDTSKEITINGTKRKFDKLLDMGYVKKDGGEYYVDLESFQTKKLNIEYYAKGV